MKTLRDTLLQLESKIMPINQVDHRFRLQHLSFGLDSLSVQATLITSTGQDFSIQCNFSYLNKSFSEWMMMDAYGAEFQVVGIVSKTLYYFARRSTGSIIQALGYEIDDM